MEAGGGGDLQICHVGPIDLLFIFADSGDEEGPKIGHFFVGFING